MTPDNTLIELLGRIAASQGKAALVSSEELAQWPTEEVTVLKAHKLIRKTRPATSVICTDCEEECVRPVHTIPDPSDDPALFVVCEKRTDINRVAVPISRLEQWQASGNSFADLIAKLLGLRRPNTNKISADRWELGMFKGKKHSSHMLLLAGESLDLNFAGHSIALADVLTLESNQFTIDKHTLTRLVDDPIDGAGDKESAEKRRERLRKRVDEEKSKGNRAFLKTVAEEEGFSTSRLKQLIKEDNKSLKQPSSRW